MTLCVSVYKTLFTYISPKLLRQRSSFMNRYFFMKRFFLENWIIIVIGVSLVASMSLAIRNNYVIEENHALQQQTQRVRSLTQNILSTTMHGLDLGVRGYGLTKENTMLRPYEEAMEVTPA